MRATFPLRLKILITLLVIVTAVVSVITFTMANMFHDDKKTYLNDLVSTVSLATADESHALLEGYEERLNTYARVLANAGLNEASRRALARDFFADFPELLAISVRRGAQTLVAVHDPSALGRGAHPMTEIARRRKTPIPWKRIARNAPWIENASFDKLPCMVMITGAAGTGTPLVVEAVVRLDALTRAVSRSDVFDVALWDANGSVLAHRDPARVLRHDVSKTRAPEMVQAGRSTNLTREVQIEGADWVEGVASASFGGVVATVRIPRSAAFLASRELLRSLMAVALLLLVVAALLGVLGSHRVTRDLERLAQATRRIAHGEFETRVAVHSRDEIEGLAVSFNDMAAGLSRRDTELREAHQQLLQSEKMAAFGQLGAGIAHEVKNPLAGILAVAQITVRSLEAGKTRDNLELIEKETKRCRTIIENLLRFARQEKVLLDLTDVNIAAADAIAIVRHQLSISQVQITTDLAADLPRIKGNANQLQQVLMNLMINAQQAMGTTGGTLLVGTALVESDTVEVRVRDSGPGIAPEIQSRIFEPFFTTKPTGQGTGLGLSVSYGIIKDHDGTISIESEPGHGATFIIRLPVAASGMSPAATLAAA